MIKEIYFILLIEGEPVSSPYAPQSGNGGGTVQSPLVVQSPQPTPQGPPPAYPSLPPYHAHLNLQHVLLQQQLLQNPQFVQANAAANANNHTGKLLFVIFSRLLFTGCRE